MELTWYVTNTLTGKIVGRLEPNSFEITEPLRSPATGSLTVPLPTDPAAVARLKELVEPHNRAVNLVDEQDRFLFAGPIPRRAAKSSDGEVTIPVVDWRSWFYQAQLRPTVLGAWRDYIKAGASAREQNLIITDLFALALELATAITPPYMVIDAAASSGITRELTARMLAATVGDLLDDIMGRERGCEWWTYATATADPTVILPHATVVWPERRQRGEPIKLEWRQGVGGNVSDVSWPEGQDFPSRVWAVGEGEPPAQVYTSTQYQEVTDGTDMLWETVIGPITGVVKKATAFEKAYSALQLGAGNSGTAEFSIVAEKLPFGDLTVGDRARVVYDDGWDTVDIAAARITQRVLSGGRGKPLQQRLSVDLSDDGYPDDGLDPGELVVDEGNS